MDDLKALKEVNGKIKYKLDKMTILDIDLQILVRELVVLRMKC